MMLTRIRALFIVAVLFITASYFLCAQPIQLHPGNPNYFLFRGEPSILITSGEHYGAVMNKDFNYRLYLETLHKEGFNYTRIFIGPYSETNSEQFGITRNTMNPKPESWLTPWSKDPVTGKYDLDSWNPDFFSRLKSFLTLASEKGIVVEVTLHTSYYVEKHWKQSPFYFRNNIQNLDSVHFNRANTLFNGSLKEYDEKYVRKIVTELNEFDNIFYEIQNEPWSDNPNLAAVRAGRVYSEWQRLVEIANNISLDWQKRIAEVITETESSLPKKHLIAQNMCNYGTRIEDDFENISIFNFHYANPLAAYENINRKAAMGLDETGFMPHNDFTYRRQAWKFMLAGGALYNNLDYSFIVRGEDGTWSIDDRTPGWGGPSMRLQFRVLKDFMEMLDFINMKPRPDLVKFSGIEIQALVNKGKQYALYVDDKTIKRLVIQVEPGTYGCDIIDPVTGKIVKQETINAFNGIAEISLSFKEDAAVILNRTGTSADTPGIQTGNIIWIQSSDNQPWNESRISFSYKKVTNPDAIVTEHKLQVVDGFGICFNELGWTALSVLEEKSRQEILKNLFDTESGLRLNICRMPIGANDYALNYYSLNDSAGDFDMKYFNIERDKKNLIPFIRAAQKIRPDLKIWGSPWTPPSWMKTNNHYACRPDVVNDMTPEQAGKEGITQFRMEPGYLSAYAKYFVKYVDAYQREEIKITGIHPQNEMNSCQNFPSCLWTATSLGHFIGSYLGPALKKSYPDLQLWYGTYERPWIEKIDTILTDPETAKYIAGVSFQWAGKQAIPGVHKKYPQLKLMQSETECGDGANDWKAAEYTYSLMNHYFKNGVSVYSFWNSILDETGKSMWGWKQNSMISIDSKTKQVNYNPEFYLLKHFSAFIDPGANMLEISGNNDDLLGFRNPDGSIVVICGNTAEVKHQLAVSINGRTLQATIEPHTFNTFIIPAVDADTGLKTIPVVPYHAFFSESQQSRFGFHSPSIP